MNEAAPPDLPSAAADAPANVAPASLARPAAAPRWRVIVVAMLALAAAVALALAWQAQRRVKAVEQELVKRQQDSQSISTEAQLLAKQAQELSRESAAKVALLEARLAELSQQRAQVNDLMQSLTHSRDESVVAEIDAAVRVAAQQAAVIGSAEPLVAALRQADERLARVGAPQLERVRRAVTNDLERAKASGANDIAALTGRIDDAVRMLDELPMLSSDPRRIQPAPARPSTKGGDDAAGAAAAVGNAAQEGSRWLAWGRDLFAPLGQELRSLLRVTRIDRPEAVLIAPEQAYFVRENLKLRLLHARIALLSRQFDGAQADLREAQAMLDRYFDGSARRVVAMRELLAQVAAQARGNRLVRPDETLAALAAAGAR